jgi:UDP-N-acetylglucosamine 4,6-dehydratase
MTGFNNASILITGGTGSFGRAFVRRLFMLYKPRRVVVYSRDELKQYEMAQELNYPQLRYFIGDIRDVTRLSRALKDIDIVVHAAALKQVPAAEYNPMECIKTNVLGAENIIEACLNRGVKKVIALSTDKACNPINLYGATKLCSDKLFIAANHLGDIGGTRFSVVRYGNVIGSRGSVVPLFRRLEAEGKPLPITDPRMTRFWITLEQGTAFVDRSLELMRGGEIFVPKIPSMRIPDLAEAVVPGGKTTVTGIRPGEKLHEIMVPRDEAINTLEFDEFYVIRPNYHMWNYNDSAIYGGMTGRNVAEGFEYASDNNTEWLSVEQLRGIIE